MVVQRVYDRSHGAVLIGTVIMGFKFFLLCTKPASEQIHLQVSLILFVPDTSEECACMA